jgi:hypothetical protein
VELGANCGPGYLRPRERATPIGILKTVLSSPKLAMKIYSERLFLKYLFSNHGICFGIDMKQSSYLFLVSKRGVILQRRPVGDKVVENLDYEIPEIVRALESERPARVTSAS